ncbi:HEPN domain-containing protein [Novacetimonas hansenii]|uniref:HEPN domain-containing protein n=1 Tax=Novacetimonas hansenii TaxID=436 RepID=UPI000A688E17|nr:HEPN domain-containing protein [Novacetimonas hansenii]
MDSKDFYEAAEAIYSNGSLKEAECRSIIHLAYYAVYHACAQILGLEVLEGRPTKRITHRGMRDYLQNVTNSNPIIEAAKKFYTGLLVMRIDADYNLTKVISMDDADDALEKAETILCINMVSKKSSAA